MHIISNQGADAIVHHAGINPQILLVDDNLVNIHVLELVLKVAGYSNLHSTTDSRQVLPLYTALRPDLILLDLQMPHLDGFAVLEQLRAVSPEASALPVLVVTADITAEARHRALALGARDVVTKPFDAADLVERIQLLLQTA